MLIGLVWILPALCQVDTSALVPFRIFTGFETTPPATVMESMKAELELILSPTGWTVDWTSLDNTLGKKSVRLAVVRFRGNCTSNWPAFPSSRQPLTLGRTYISDGVVLPFIDVLCDSVRIVAARKLDRMGDLEREPAFARGLARVLAHELYHVLGNSTLHAVAGLAKPSLNAEDLTKEVYRFTGDEVHKLRNEAMPVLLSCYPRLEPRRADLALFVNSGCTTCHGPLGEGTPGGPSLADLPNVDAAAVASHLNNPKSSMHQRSKTLQMSWPKLGTDAIDALVRYVKKLGLGAAGSPTSGMVASEGIHPEDH